MKKIYVMLFLLMTAIYVTAQNPTIIQGQSAVTNMAGSSTAATSDSIEVGKSNTYQIINGEYDWSLQIMPVQYGTLTSDSVYATIKILVSNMDNDNEWSEPKQWDSFATGGLYTYPLRDTIANTTVALSTGIVKSGKDFQYKRIKVLVSRPQTTDSVGYRVNYVFKLHQDQAR